MPLILRLVDQYIWSSDLFGRGFLVPSLMFAQNREPWIFKTMETIRVSIHKKLGQTFSVSPTKHSVDNFQRFPHWPLRLSLNGVQGDHVLDLKRTGTHENYVNLGSQAGHNKLVPRNCGWKKPLYWLKQCHRAGAKPFDLPWQHKAKNEHIWE